MILLAQNCIWLALEYLWLDWTKPWKFRAIRVIYFGFLGFTRNDIVDNMDPDDKYWRILWKTFKMFIIDLLSMLFIVWAFGRSHIYYVSLLECAFVLTMMIFPERLCSGYKSFL